MLDSLLHNSGLQPVLRSSGGLNTCTSNMRQWFCSAAASKQASELPQNGDLDRVILLLVLVREAGRTLGRTELYVCIHQLLIRNQSLLYGCIVSQTCTKMATGIPLLTWFSKPGQKNKMAYQIRRWRIKLEGLTVKTHDKCGV